MFQLKRSDVLPVGDLGIKKGLMKHFKLKKLPTESQMQELTAPWAPYRTLACYLLYKILDTPTPTPDATPTKRKRAQAERTEAPVDEFASGGKRKKDERIPLKRRRRDDA